MKIDISVIIVTYNSASSIDACLASITSQADVVSEIIVVDNASVDGTLAKAEGFGVQLLAHQENIGFGNACNIGFDASHGTYLYFINPDAELTRPDSLKRLCGALEDHPAWGMVGTRIISSEGFSESPPGYSYPGQFKTSNNFSSLPGRIAWVLGASMFFRREVFAELNGFDPDFFLYSEETDLCLRLRKMGHEIGFLSDVEVSHIGGVSEEGSDPYDVWVRRMNGLHLFWKKHYSADDAARLVRRDLFRARYRMLANSLISRLQPPQSKAWQKSRRYQAIWEASARFLSKK